MPKGFNKSKLKGALGIILLISVAAIIYVTTRDQLVSSNVKEVEKAPQNYSRNNSNADVNDIVGPGNKVIAESHTAVASNSKQNASNPQVASTQTAQQEAQMSQEIKTSMRAPLNSNQLAPTLGPSGAVRTGQTSAPVKQDYGLPKDDPNQTSEKREFLKSQNDSSSNVLSSSLSNPIAPLVLSMGTKLPAQLDQEINSDLPGQIYGHVSRDVFDSRTHSNLLIPAGSNLVGTYDSAIMYGQERLLVAWKRVNLPNGQWLDIQGMGGADPDGAGFGGSG